VGILLAFGIDAAWDTAQERRAVEAYLASLQVEVAANRTWVEARIETLEENAAKAEQYLADIVVSPTGPVSQDSIRGMVYEMGGIRIQPPQRAAFDDLVSGGLQAIEDGEIRRLILAYGQALELDAARSRQTEAWFDNRAQVYDEQEADLVGMGSLFDGGWAGRTDLSFNIDPSSFVRNRRYGNLLAARVYRIGAVVSAQKELLTRLIELQTYLDAIDPAP
jgi:hypothetical protein